MSCSSPTSGSRRRVLLLPVLLASLAATGCTCDGGWLAGRQCALMPIERPPPSDLPPTVRSGARGRAAATGAGHPWTAMHEASPYLLVFAGDRDERDEDFLAVVDVRPGSPTLGRVLATTPIGLKGSMPHHMEYEPPAAGELLFANAHHHEAALLIDTSDPLNPVIRRTLGPPPPLRFGHASPVCPAAPWSLAYCEATARAPHRATTGSRAVMAGSPSTPGRGS
jgi:hypothetical protein